MLLLPTGHNTVPPHLSTFKSLQETLNTRKKRVLRLCLQHPQLFIILLLEWLGPFVSSPSLQPHKEGVRGERRQLHVLLLGQAACGLVTHAV